ncbi:MAG: hypothetical protein CVT66_11615, partial [Actinobacteria bacterium HGW-Actinobacteria-6]
AGCTFPGCDARPTMCEAHHVVPWWAGGATALSNLASCQSAPWATSWPRAAAPGERVKTDRVFPTWPCVALRFDL